MIIDETQGTPELDEAFATITPTVTATQGEPTMHTQNTNTLPIDVATPDASEPEDTLSAMLVTALMAMLTPRIEAMVEKKFAELATNADTLAQMSDNFRTEITSLIDEAVSGALSDHVSEYDHHDTDAIDALIRSMLHTQSSILDNATVSISV